MACKEDQAGDQEVGGHNDPPAFEIWSDGYIGRLDATLCAPPVLHAQHKKHHHRSVASLYMSDEAAFEAPGTVSAATSVAKISAANAIRRAMALA